MGRTAAICIGLLAAIWFVYGQTRDFDFVTYDDPDYVTENPPLAAGLSRAGLEYALKTPVMGFYHPVTMLTLLADYEFFGLEAGGYHLVNVALHALNTLLLFGFLQYATRRTWPSAAVAALFAVHPLHVESVAWISERKDVLSTCFGFGSIWAYLAHAQRPRRGLYALSVVLLVLGLLSKSMLVTIPVLLLLLDVWPLGRLELPARGEGFTVWWRALRPRLVEKIPFFAAAVVAGLITLWIQREMGAMGDTAIAEGSLGIAVSDLPNVVVSYARYVAMNLWPSDLSVLYPHPVKPHAGGTPLAGWEPVEAVVFLALFTHAVVRSRRIDAATGWLWFTISLLPVIGIIQIGTLSHADRYTYLPSVGLFWLVCFAYADAASTLAQRHAALRPIAAVVAVAVIAGYAVAARDATSAWRDSITLYEQALRVNSRNTMMHYNLGNNLRKLGRTDEASERFRKVTSLDPGHYKAHINLGEAHAAQGRHEAAVAEYEFALRIVPDNVVAHNNLANSLKDLDRLEEALFHYKAAVRLNDGNPLPHYNLGNFYMLRKEFEEAIEQYRLAVRLNPRYSAAMGNMGNAFMRLGQIEAASESYRSALAIDPKSAVAKAGLELIAGRASEPAPAPLASDG